MKKSITLICIISMLLSCSSDHGYTETGCDTMERIDLILESTPSITKGQSVTTNESVINDVTLAAYGISGELTDCRYFRNGRDMFLMLDKNHVYTVYAIANMGDKCDSMPESENDLSHMTEKISWEMVNDKGFPMTGSATYVKGSSSLSIPVSRLLAKVTLTIDTDWPEPCSFKLKEVTVGNTNSMVSLFGRSSAESKSDLMSGDRSIVMAPNMTFYLPENMHGNLLSSNRDPYLKNKEMLVSEGYERESELCSYMDVILTQEDTYGISGDRRYRFYIGSDNIMNFDVVRNTDYNITLKLTFDGFNLHDNWKIDNDGVSDNRSLSFGKKEYQAIAGSTSYIDVNFIRSGILDSSYGWFNSATGWEFTDIDPVLDISTASTASGIAITPFTGKAHFGDRIPIKVHTFDDVHSDIAYINITIPEVETSWAGGLEPAYIAQKGTLTAKIPEGLDRITFEIDEDSREILELIDNPDGSSVQVCCIGAGNGKIRVTGHSGGKKVDICEKILTVSAPLLKSTPATVSVPATGSRSKVATIYTDKNGRTMNASSVQSRTSFDPALYDRLLKPVTSISMTDAGMFMDANAEGICANKVKVNGKSILDYCGLEHAGTIKFAPCNQETARQVKAAEVKCIIEDPFPGASASRFLGYVNNKYDGSVGTVHTSAVDVSENKESVFQTVVTPLTSNVFVSCEAKDIDMGLSTGRITLRRNTTTADYSAGLYEISGKIYNTAAKEYSPQKIIGCFESYLMTGFVAYASDIAIDYRISAGFVNRFNISYFNSMISSIKDKRIFGFIQGSTTYISTQYYVFDSAEDDNGVYISPWSSDFYSWGSWCNVVAYDDNHLVASGQVIYSQHIGLTDRTYWEESGYDFYSTYDPLIRVDVSRLDSTDGLGQISIGKYKLLYSTSDTIKGKAGVPYHLVGLPASKDELVPIPWNR